MPSINDKILGALYLGSFMATMLFGVACIQTWFYFRHSQRDRLLFKTTVFVVTILNSTQLFVQSYLMYRLLVTHFGNYAMAQMATIPSCVQVAIASLSDLVVRIFFARRVYIVCGQKKRFTGTVLSGFIFLVSLSAFVFMLIYNNMSYAIGIKPISPERTSALLSITYMLYVVYSLSAVGDLAIAASLSGLLWRKKTGFKRTDHLVTFWVLFSVHTGLVTSVFAILALILLGTHPDSFYSLGFTYVLTELHVNSLLASLNARGAFRNESTFNATTAGHDDHLSYQSSGCRTTPKVNFPSGLSSVNLQRSGYGRKGGVMERDSTALCEVEMALSRNSSRKLVIGKEEEVRVYTDDGKITEL